MHIRAGEGKGAVVSLGKISVQVVLISFKMQQSMFMPPLNQFSLQISSKNTEHSIITC